MLKTEQGNFPDDQLFSRESVKIRHSGNLVVFALKDKGLIEFDYETGKMLWSIAF